MDYYMNSAGCTSPCVKEYEVSATQNLKKGTVLTYSEGAASAASTSSTAILGILAEDYNTNKDEFNPRNGNGYVKVIVSPSAIYRQPAFTTTLTAAGTATSITVAGHTMPTAANTLKGGYIKLISKASGSANTDKVGTVRKISASSGNTLTVTSGGTAAIGDVYEILPPAGFNCLAVNSSATGYNLAAAANSTVKIVRSDAVLDISELCFTATLFN